METSDGSSVLSKKVSHFLSTLYTILEKEYEKGEKIIKWSKNGQWICVSDPARMSDTILPTYYKHKNYSTFVRQLNLYGFHKGVDEDGNDIFVQPLFVRGRKELMGLIRRNQKQAKKGGSQPKELHIITAPHETDLYERLTQDIRLLQAQQQLLDVSLRLLSERQEHEQGEFAEKLQKKDEIDAAGYMLWCVLFVLENYLHRSSDVLLLESGCRDRINNKIAICRDSHKRLCIHQACECEFITLLNLKCKKTPNGKRKSFKEKCKEFFDWLRKFLSANALNFPCAESFFFTLIICTVASKGTDPDSLTTEAIIEKLVSELASRNGTSEIMSDGPAMQSCGYTGCSPSTKYGHDQCDCCHCMCCEEID